jgi:hypothetical protein
VKNQAMRHHSAVDQVTRRSDGAFPSLIERYPVKRDQFPLLLTLVYAFVVDARTRGSSGGAW